MTVIEELRKLPLAERRKIVDELEESIREEEACIAETPEWIAELRRRSAELKANPSSGISWEEVEKRILSKCG